MEKPGRMTDPSTGRGSALRKAISNYSALFCKGRIGVMIAAWLLFSSFVPGQADNSSALWELGCQECHLDLSPAVRDSSLKTCPKSSVINQSSQHSLAEAPDSFLITNLVDGYTPVCFEHRSHARMAEMGDKCTTCHHYCPARGIIPCGDCHGPDTHLGGLIRADLEEACHHVCLGCHQEWDHEARCDACHVLTTNTSGVPFKPGDPLPYPAIPTPARKVFRTSLEQYPIVTFQHVEHIELFEFACSDCHQQEECARCHNPVKRDEYVESQVDIRAVCAGCHDTGNGTSSGTSCTKCHDTAEKPLIFHPIVGYEIPCYWKWLTCSSCHP